MSEWVPIVPTVVQTASSYLRSILDREAVDVSAESRLRQLTPRIDKIVRAWAGKHLVDLQPSGAFEQGMANASGVAIDFLASIHPDATFTPREIYESLYHALDRMGLKPKARNVSVGVTLGGITVDIIPARRDNMHTEEHWLHSSLRGKAFITDPHTHILEAIKAKRSDEVRVIKLWRDKNGLVFPSFYLELAVTAALRGKGRDLADNVWSVFGYLENHFVARSVLDPANAHNVVSDDIDIREKARIRTVAKVTRAARSWQDILS